MIKAPEDPCWLDRLFGSDDLHLLRKCPCPVWMIKPRLSGTFGCIVVAVDVDDGYSSDEIEGRRALNRQLMEMATSLALAEFAELQVVHAWEAIGEGVMRSGFMGTDEESVKGYVKAVERHHGENLHTLMRQTADRLGPEATRYLKPNAPLGNGWARKEIPALIRELRADLLVAGTVARTGVSGLLMGNTAEMILTQIDCSVLAAKPGGSCRRSPWNPNAPDAGLARSLASDSVVWPASPDRAVHISENAQTRPLRVPRRWSENAPGWGE